MPKDGVQKTATRKALKLWIHSPSMYALAQLGLPRWGHRGLSGLLRKQDSYHCPLSEQSPLGR